MIYVGLIKFYKSNQIIFYIWKKVVLSLLVVGGIGLGTLSSIGSNEAYANSITQEIVTNTSDTKVPLIDGSDLVLEDYKGMEDG